MFSLIQSKPALNTFDISSSEFHKDYPKESFNIEDPENSPVESVLYYCCGIIHESGLFTFRIDAFGEHINIPIRPELSILLEQFRGLISFLRGDIRKTEIDFYEQGCVMTIQFSKSADSIHVYAHSKANYRTFQQQVSQDEMTVSTTRFLLEFLNAVSLLTPAMLREPAFEKWFSEVLFTPTN